MSTSARRALWLLLALLCVPSYLELRARAFAHQRQTRQYEDVYYLPPPVWLKLGSLGHNEALAGMVWLKALVYFGEELVRNGDVRNLYRYADAMIALDPYFKRVYHWAGSCAIYRTGDVTVDDTWKSIEYLEAGAKLFPDDGELAWDLGATYLYELPPLLKSEEEKNEVRRKGLEHLRVASLKGTAPPWLSMQIAVRLDGLGRLEQAIGYLQEIYPTVTDEKTKRSIEQNLVKLMGQAYAEAFRRTDEELSTEHQATFPYADNTLFLMLRPRPAFDPLPLLRNNFDPAGELFGEDYLSGDAQEPVAAQPLALTQLAPPDAGLPKQPLGGSDGSEGPAPEPAASPVPQPGPDAAATP